MTAPPLKAPGHPVLVLTPNGTLYQPVNYEWGATPHDCHPLFPWVDVTTFNPNPARHPTSPATLICGGFGFIPLGCSPYHQDQPPCNPYTQQQPAPAYDQPGPIAPAYDQPAPPKSPCDTNANPYCPGGCIESLRHANHRQHALASNISPLDIADLGNVAYHSSIRGHNPLTMSIVHKCAYTELNSTDVIKSYNDIIYLHAEVLDRWEHPHGLYRGPQINRILEKDLTTFPHLTSLTMSNTVEFYNAFQKTSAIYLFPVMPFDCISLRMGFEALCPPGLGIQRCATIAQVLMEILPNILPCSNTQFNLIVNMVRMDSGNGYDLMWHVLVKKYARRYLYLTF
jgi:hypothetical protein